MSEAAIGNHVEPYHMADLTLTRKILPHTTAHESIIKYSERKQKIFKICILQTQLFFVVIVQI